MITADERTKHQAKGMRRGRLKFTAAREGRDGEDTVQKTSRKEDVADGRGPGLIEINFEEDL